MERVLELLNGDSSHEIELGIRQITPSLLNSAGDQHKHKLKTKISSLLKSSGRNRAYGAIAARRALVDWSVIKSHGASWAVIMLHVLDIPDHVCWSPVSRTLTYLFSKVHGKADLARDVAGSKIGDFVKRLVATVKKTGAFYAVEQMLRLYPTQCRPYLNKLQPILAERSPATLGYLCIGEKQGTQIWTERFNAHLDVLKSHEKSKLSEQEFSDNFKSLESYIFVAPLIGAKVPVGPLLAVITKLLASFTPAAVQHVCGFVEATFPLLKPAYLSQFESLVYAFGDCLDVGHEEAIAAVRVISLMVQNIGWISENYTQLFTRLTRKVLALIQNQQAIIGAQGLADYIQNPAVFSTPLFDDKSRADLVDFLTMVIVYVPTVPQSTRNHVDKVILELGTRQELVQATLYPTKYSILPLAIQRNPELIGLENLVHPRFPPLNTSKMYHEQAFSGEGEEDTYYNAEPEVRKIVTKVEETVEADPEPETVQAPVAMPSIPESIKPAEKRPGEDSPPEKRVKLSAEDLFIKPAETQGKEEDAVEVEDQEEESIEEQDEEEEGGEEDDELIIPSLVMDSD